MTGNRHRRQRTRRLVPRPGANLATQILWAALAPRLPRPVSSPSARPLNGSEPGAATTLARPNTRPPVLQVRRQGAGNDRDVARAADNLQGYPTNSQVHRG